MDIFFEFRLDINRLHFTIFNGIVFPINNHHFSNVLLINYVTGFQLIYSFNAPNNIYMEGILYVKAKSTNYTNESLGFYFQAISGKCCFFFHGCINYIFLNRGNFWYMLLIFDDDYVIKKSIYYNVCINNTHFIWKLS